MRIAIIGAMDEEVDWLKDDMKEVKESERAGVLFYHGKLEEKDVVLLRSGIGKVNAAIATSLLMQLFEPDVVINTGSAGGFNSELEVGDLVISEEVRYNDVDACVFGYEFGQVPGMPAFYEPNVSLVATAKDAAAEVGLKAQPGLIISGDSFMSDEKRIQFLRETFTEPQCAEMEAAAIAHVCHQFAAPFVIIRSLSDIAGQDAKMSYDQFLKKAGHESAKLVTAMIKKID
ncbi:5'-methylthioadenosine/S-adenosylhomocysteine nucleosidase [Salsuginibacillus kocurii]|uniref:5'-methylthioadenosine/S-adenosylhomocysteine nucleosidase n=1 Tax=Salsuginibacillus kocurii TaxID=427078 RepID=UPI000375E2B7|nr:5'-methylthioadenosine/S-adenosylhomocysteine nucleosidase [Salsuginibacillus kocurii]